jgi:hypothetical protein
MLDLRIPSGLFFTTLGLILAVLGAVSPDLRAPLTQGNVNLYCGLFMLCFGAFLLWLAQRARRKQS